MTRDALESSLDKGRPVELYEFRYGPDDANVYRYTDGDQTVEFGGQDFTPLALKRGRITATGTTDKTSITVNLPVSSPVCELFRVYAPPYPVLLTIRGGHQNDPDADFAVVWTGRVLSCNRMSGQRFQAALTCEMASTSIKRPGLRRNYQFTCPHVFCGAKCGLNAADWQITATVTALTGAGVTFGSGWNGAVDWQKYMGGLLTFLDDAGITNYRTILRSSDGLTLSLSGPTTGMTVGSDVTLLRACNHQLDQCTDDFSNVLNYGGHPWIPLSNPIKTNPFTTGG